MDKIKSDVASKVASLVKDTNWNTVVSTDRPNEAYPISDLETMIKIRTSIGPRVFVVKVREMI